MSVNKDMLEFVAENDVKFIRLSFTDIFGVQKNISINPNELEKAIDSGIAICPDGVLGFSEYKKQLFLIPSVSTLSVLPWRPTHGRVIRFFCDIVDEDKKPFVFDYRKKLSVIENSIKEMGLDVGISTECEFYLFNTDELGNPTKKPFDNGGAYDINPLDKGENVRREICLALEEMGISYITSHHERGKGQNEILFKESEPLSAADNFINFKSVVKAISARNGLYATFMPKPMKDDFGSGHKIIIRLKNADKETFESFASGILSSLSEITAILNSTVNSYERLGTDTAEKVFWSSGFDGAVRIVEDKIELSTPDSALNPYLAFAAILTAGVNGIKEKLALKESKVSYGVLPESLIIALNETEKSKVAKDAVGEEALNIFIEKKKKEVNDYLSSSNMEEYIINNYFIKL